MRAVMVYLFLLSDLAAIGGAIYIMFFNDQNNLWTAGLMVALLAYALWVTHVLERIVKNGTSKAPKVHGVPGVGTD